MRVNTQNNNKYYLFFGFITKEGLEFLVVFYFTIFFTILFCLLFHAKNNMQPKKKKNKNNTFVFAFVFVFIWHCLVLVRNGENL